MINLKCTSHPGRTTRHDEEESPRSSLVDDLCADSLICVDLVMSLADESFFFTPRVTR
jgi:hypothetical protein